MYLFEYIEKCRRSFYRTSSPKDSHLTERNALPRSIAECGKAQLWPRAQQLLLESLFHSARPAARRSLWRISRHPFGLFAVLSSILWLYVLYIICKHIIIIYLYVCIAVQLMFVLLDEEISRGTSLRTSWSSTRPSRAMNGLGAGGPRWTCLRRSWQSAWPRRHPSTRRWEPLGEVTRLRRPWDSSWDSSESSKSFSYAPRRSPTRQRWRHVRAAAIGVGPWSCFGRSQRPTARDQSEH